MIEGITGSSNLQAMSALSASTQNAQLTEDQKVQLQDILAQYDPSNMTEDDKMALLDELKSSGIEPSDEVKSIIDEAGFDLEPPEGPPPGAMEGMQAQRPDFVQDAISKYESDELSDEDIDELVSKLKEWGEPPQGILLDQKS